MTKAMLIATLLFSGVSFAQAPTEAPKPAESVGTAGTTKAEGNEKKKHHKKDKKGAGIVKKANNKG